MGRNKAHAPLSKAERKRVKNGARVEDNTNQNARREKYPKPRNSHIADTRGRASSRGPRHSQTSNNLVHAALFVVLGAVPVTLRGPLDWLYSQVPSVLVNDWRRPITPADLVAWRRNLTERFGDLNAAARTARRTVLNSTFWAEQIRAMA